jgi:hypothetical protein
MMAIASVTEELKRTEATRPGIVRRLGIGRLAADICIHSDMDVRAPCCDGAEHPGEVADVTVGAEPEQLPIVWDAA